MSYPRTDLALESTEQLEHLPAGVTLQEETHGPVRVTRIGITTADAAEKLGRAQGNYITVELPAVESGEQAEDEAAELLRAELATLLPQEGAVLVVGLGNRQITPDALGPETVRQLFVTRHIPDDIAQQTGLDGLRAVSALAPGVLGQTGIETGEIVRAVVRDTAPAAVLVIDAFAARSLSRLGRTIQLADSGISPGSGVRNARKELSEHSLGVPVVSVGIPTVVDGGTLAREATGQEDIPVDPAAAGMMVTPRDIDQIIARGAKCLSTAINRALHPRLSAEELTYLVS